MSTWYHTRSLGWSHHASKPYVYTDGMITEELPLFNFERQTIKFYEAHQSLIESLVAFINDTRYS